jgi:integrase/recombinase XerD
MLSVYTRHAADCAKAKDKDWRRCRCPKWISGTHDGELIRKSAKTRSWEKAEEYRRLLEGVSIPTPVQAYESVRISDRAPTGHHRDQKKARVTVETAVEAYLSAARSRGLESSTLSKLEGIFRKQFLAWCSSQGYKFLDEVDLDALVTFRDTWIDGPLAKRKKQERLIGFFWACVRRRYITENPTFGLGKIKVDQTPTDYFPPHEFDKIVDATYAYRENRGEIGNTNSTRLRIMTLLMRWSGLRIRDAVTLEKTRLHGDSLLLYQAKTGTPVYVPLPSFLVESLRALPPGPKPNRRYFFWSGNGLAKSAVANWQRSFRRLFTLADIRRPDGSPKRCHPHMFRDTFAVEMLLAGVPIDQVSILLGHASVKITEKHYSPWVKARQIQLQQSVRNAWPVEQSKPTISATNRRRLKRRAAVVKVVQLEPSVPPSSMIN